MDAWVPILLPYGLSPLHHHIELTGGKIAIPPLGSKRWITPSLKQLSSSTLTTELSRALRMGISAARRSKKLPESGQAPPRWKRKGKRKASAKHHVKKAVKKRKSSVGSASKGNFHVDSEDEDVNENEANVEGVTNRPASRRGSHSITITVPDLSHYRYNPAAQGHVDRMQSLSGQWSLFTLRRTLSSGAERTQSSGDAQQSGTRIEHDSGPPTTLRHLKESGRLLRVKQSTPHPFKPASQDTPAATDLRTTSVRGKHAQHNSFLPANKADLRRQSVAAKPEEEVMIKIDFDDPFFIYDTDAPSPTPAPLRKVRALRPPKLSLSLKSQAAKVSKMRIDTMEPARTSPTKANIGKKRTGFHKKRSKANSIASFVLDDDDETISDFDAAYTSSAEPGSTTDADIESVDEEDWDLEESPIGYSS